MDFRKRSPAKQAMIEAALADLQKYGVAYKSLEELILSGKYLNDHHSRESINRILNLQLNHLPLGDRRSKVIGLLELINDDSLEVIPEQPQEQPVVRRVDDAFGEEGGEGTMKFNATPANAVEQVLEQPAVSPCDVLYDPCTGKALEVNSVEALEKRVREIRNRLSDNPETEHFPDSIKTRLDLLLHMLNRGEPPNSNLFKYTINGQLYEAYWDIVFSLNLMDEFQRTDDFYMVNKKAELIQASEPEIYVNNPIEYLRKRNVNEGASGASDITFCYKKPNEIIEEDSCSATPVSCSPTRPGDSRMRFYFCSSKFYKKDASKSAESFDIQKIYTAVKKLHSDYDVRIILLVKDKNAVDIKLKNARNKYISEEASSVYGERDLFAALLKLYDLAHQKIQGTITEDTLKSVLGITDKIKPLLSPRLHQHMAILKIQKAIQKFKTSGGNNKFLVGILPRGGKTYIAGGIVSLLQPHRVVVLLGAKSETISQFTNDLFRFYQDFSDYQIVDVLEGGNDVAINPVKKYIFVMSVELYKMEASSRRILIELKSGQNRADLFICDEAHLKQLTPKAIKELEEGTAPLKLAEEEDAEEVSQLDGLDKEISREVPVIYMSGTYKKPLDAFKIPEENVAIWDYQDIQEGKNIVDNEQYFKENFPGIYEEALAKCFAYGETYETIQTMYRRFPNLYLLSTQFTDDAKTSFLTQSQGGEKVGFPTITHLFQVKKNFEPHTTAPTNWHTGFTNAAGIARLINYLSPRSELAEGSVISSVMKRIDRISQRIGDRLAFFTKDFVVHSQLWFLPTMQGHPLIKRMSALAGVIFQSPWYRKHFNILGVSSSADWSKIGGKDRRIKIGEGTFSWACPDPSKGSLKSCILREEAAARAEGKGLVILAQNMLHLGISLSCVDIVVLLDAGEKVDERIQKMYRALTESTNKKGGFIVDMNYFRTVTAIMNYQIQTIETRQKKKVYTDSGLKEAFNSIIETYSIDDDIDIYGSKEEGGSSRIESETIPELQRMMKKAPSARGDGITIMNAGAALNRNIESVLKSEYDRGLDTILGEMANDPEKKLLREHGENVGAAEEEKEDKESAPRVPKLFPNAVEKNPVEKRKAFIDIFKTTLKLGVFGTEYRTIAELLEGFRTDNDLRDIVYETLVRRGAIQDGADKEYVNRIIMAELRLLSEKKEDSYKGMKEAFNSRDSRKQTFQEILDYIKENLTPKDTERHKFGEVFTPLTLVDEMLSKLPADVWTKKEWKWLDPANGIGNFPIKAFIGQTEGEHTYPGLFEGLKKDIPDDKKRCKWIIEEMLYMIDINGKNNMIAKKLFEKLCPGAKANIDKIDSEEGFLSSKPLAFNGKAIKNFDVIMGNPPYNSGGILKGGGALWPHFVKMAFNLVKENGYICFVHPPGWRMFYDPEDNDNQGKIWYRIRENGWTLDYLNVSDQPPPHFPNVDYYVIHAKKTNNPTKYDSNFKGISSSGEATLEYPFIPNMLNDETMSILKKLFVAKGEPIHIIRNQSFKPTALDKGKPGIPHYHFTAKTGEKQIYRKEYSSVPEYINEAKVIMTFKAGYQKGRLFAFYSDETMGTTANSMYMLTRSKGQGDKLVNFFNSDIITFLMKITQYSASPNHINAFKILNQLEVPDSLDYGLTKKEKDLIEKVLQESAPRRGKTEKVSKSNSSGTPRKFRKTHRKSRV